MSAEAGAAADGGSSLPLPSPVRPHHVGISVADLEESIAWYERVLGFRLEALVAVPEDEGRVAMLGQDGFRVELFEIPGAAALPPARREPGSDLRTHGVKHLAYEVSDVEAHAERLRALGVDVVWDVRVHEDVKVLFVRDNTGNLVELVEPLEAAGAARGTV